jgi:hypothetical protein
MRSTIFSPRAPRTQERQGFLISGYESTFKFSRLRVTDAKASLVRRAGGATIALPEAVYDASPARWHQWIKEGWPGANAADRSRARETGLQQIKRYVTHKI